MLPISGFFFFAILRIAPKQFSTNAVRTELKTSVNGIWHQAGEPSCQLSSEPILTQREFVAFLGTQGATELRTSVSPILSASYVAC